MTKQPAYKDVKFKIVGDLANTDIVMNDTFWIGVWPGLSLEMLDYVINTINEILSEKL